MTVRSVLEFSPGSAGPVLAREEAAKSDWRDAALCAQADPEAWFPEKGVPATAAKRVCRACPSVVPCLEYALANNEKFGVWGAKSEAERRRMLASRRTGPVPLCTAGLHPMTGDNILAFGACRGCRLDREKCQRDQAQIGRAA